MDREPVRGLTHPIEISTPAPTRQGQRFLELRAAFMRQHPNSEITFDAMQTLMREAGYQPLVSHEIVLVGDDDST